MQVFNYHYGYEGTGFGLVVLLDQILLPNITASSLHHACNGSKNALSNSKTGGPILQITPKTMAGRENGENGAFEAARGTYKTGLHHLNESSQLTFVRNVYGGSLLSSGGMLALTPSVGASVLQESNPRIPRVLQGLLFQLDQLSSIS